MNEKYVKRCKYPWASAPSFVYQRWFGNRIIIIIISKEKKVSSITEIDVTWEHGNVVVGLLDVHAIGFNLHTVVLL